MIKGLFDHAPYGVQEIESVIQNHRLSQNLCLKISVRRAAAWKGADKASYTIRVHSMCIASFESKVAVA